MERLGLIILFLGSLFDQDSFFSAAVARARVVRGNFLPFWQRWEMGD